MSPIHINIERFALLDLGNIDIKTLPNEVWLALI